MAKGTKTLNSALKVDNDKNVFITVSGGAPPDGAVDHLEIVLWLDAGDGNKLKAKSRIGGAVYNYELAPLP